MAAEKSELLIFKINNFLAFSFFTINHKLKATKYFINKD